MTNWREQRDGLHVVRLWGESEQTAQERLAERNNIPFFRYARSLGSMQIVIASAGSAKGKLVHIAQLDHERREVFLG